MGFPQFVRTIVCLVCHCVTQLPLYLMARSTRYGFVEFPFRHRIPLDNNIRRIEGCCVFEDRIRYKGGHKMIGGVLEGFLINNLQER